MNPAGSFPFPRVASGWWCVHVAGPTAAGWHYTASNANPHLVHATASRKTAHTLAATAAGTVAWATHFSNGSCKPQSPPSAPACHAYRHNTKPACVSSQVQTLKSDAPHALLHGNPNHDISTPPAGTCHSVSQTSTKSLAAAAAAVARAMHFSSCKPQSPPSAPHAHAHRHIASQHVCSCRCRR